MISDPLDMSLPVAMAVAMEKELDANSHKSGWQDMTPRELLTRLKQEVAELERAINRVKPPTAIWSEAADVANFAAMLASVYTSQAIEIQEAIDNGTT